MGPICIIICIPPGCVAPSHSKQLMYLPIYLFYQLPWWSYWPGEYAQRMKSLCSSKHFFTCIFIHKLTVSRKQCCSNRVMHKVLNMSWVFTWQTHKTLPDTGAACLFCQTWQQSLGIICFVLLTVSEWPCRVQYSVWCANIVRQPHLPPGLHKWVNKYKMCRINTFFSYRYSVSGPKLGNSLDLWEGRDYVPLQRETCTGRRRGGGREENVDWELML